MRLWVATALVALVGSSPPAQGPDYAALWQQATPYAAFLEEVRARRDQWHSRSAEATIASEAATRVQALPSRRRILAVAEDRCSDSAWALPYLARLAAAAPEILELRVLSSRLGSRIQSDHVTPDGRLATPTVVVLDEQDRLLGAWVERPEALQKWYVGTGATLSAGERSAYLSKWYAEDAGRSTINEVLAIIERRTEERKED